ncbi:unnamed protein product [Lampetra fluviatilis]
MKEGKAFIQQWIAKKTWSCSCMKPLAESENAVAFVSALKPPQLRADSGSSDRPDTGMEIAPLSEIYRPSKSLPAAWLSRKRTGR